MGLKKPLKNLRTAILVPCYKRPEYTLKTLDALFYAEYIGYTTLYVWLDGVNSWDSNEVYNKLAELGNLRKDVGLVVNVTEENIGLREIILQFFDICKNDDIDIMAKMDNDCIVPKDWMIKLLNIFQDSPADVLSPNVYPSNAGGKHGKMGDDTYGYWPTKNIGGLWIMKVALIRDMVFERHDLNGITGAIPVLRQIVHEKDPIMGWVHDVVIDDIGHWSGQHPDNIKTKEHEEYYREIGRNIAWSV